AEVAAVNNSSSIPNTVKPLLIGRRNFEDGRIFGVNGHLDDVAIWSRGLTTSEVANLWNGGQLSLTTRYYADSDGDGFGNAASSVLACTPPSGYVTNANDCDDANPNVNPAAIEICNYVDDNCNGQIDEGLQSTFYADADHDGYGNPSVSLLACTQPTGYVTNDDDCNDGNMNVHPGATETCNGLDDDCDGLTDDADPTVTGQSTWYQDADHDGYGNSALSFLACSAPTGYVANDDDCDDTNMNIHPGATETCNLVDDDCDGLIDEGTVLTFYADADGDGYGDATHSQVGCITPSGYVANDDDCNDANNAIHPGALEICNLIDDDCDGLVDEGVKLTFYADSDNDGYGNPASSVLACVQPSGYVANNNDCNDNNANVHPGASEICNSLDDNCDGQIDEGYAISVAASSVSSSNGNNFCPGGSTLLSVVGGSLGTGADWFWYEGGCGSGSSIGTGSSVSVAPSSGVHTYYVRAEGSCNTSACTSTSITVYSSPAFTSCPSDITAGNTSSLCSAIRTYSALASGNPAPSLSYTFSGATTGSGTGTGSGSVFNKGTTLVTITAINSCGSSICSFNITINDSEGPVISGCPSATNAVVEEGQWGAHVSWTPPTATDNCGMGTITSTRMPGDFFNVGSTVVTYTATDVNGNSSTCQFYVTVAPPDLVGKVNIS
ncbi:MAG TPA: MopE-related protein, partial [Saprospiraceae bacterium]|nr:MopE-related protein [Saprospiraceae bacterium]